MKTVHWRMGQYGGKDVVGIPRKWMSNFFVPRVHCPEVSSKAKAVEHCRFTMQPIWKRLRLFFAKIISVNRLSLYGAVAEMCEEYETLHDRSGQPAAGGKSSSPLALSVTKTEVSLDCDDLANQDLLLQQYGERIEKLSQQDQLSKFCVDAGFLNVVEIGQYFMTKDTAEISQFRAVACCEYTFFQEKKRHHNQDDGCKETPKLGLCWKLQFVDCMVNTELRSEFCL